MSFIDTNRETLAACRDGGLLLDGVGGEHRIEAVFADSASGVEKADAVLIHTDTNNTRAAAETAAQVLAADGFAITLQNGIGNVEILSEVLGAGRVLGGISYHSAASPAPGHSSHTHDGPTWLGELDGSGSVRLTALRDAIAATGMTVEAVDNINSVIWTKFVHNCAINPISALTGWRVGEISACAGADEMQTRIIEEIAAVVAAKGITLTNPDTISAPARHTVLGITSPSNTRTNTEAADNASAHHE